MLVLLRQISLPELRRHPLRTGITAMAVLIGVALFCAVRVAGGSLSAALRDTISAISGQASLQVTAGEAGFPEAVLAALQSAPGVRHASPVIEVVVRTREARQGNVLILGLDLAHDRRWRGDSAAVAVPDPGALLRNDDSLIVSRELAERNGLETGDAFELLTPRGERRFIVRGIMEPSGVARAFGGNIAVMGLGAAQRTFERAGVLDRIELVLEDGAASETVRAAVAERLGAGFVVAEPLRRGRQTESLMQAFSLILLMASSMALLVGVFLIYNAFTVSVSERRGQIGVLRALGMTRRRIQQLFLGECLLLGFAASLVGVVAGIALGRAMMFVIAVVVEQTYGVKVAIHRFTIEPTWVLLSIAAGLLASLVGGYLPAREAAATEPTAALQKGRYQVLFAGESRRRRWFGLALLVLSMPLAASAWSRSLWQQVLFLVIQFAAITLLVPSLTDGLARLLRKPIARLAGLEGRLAGDSLVQSPRRTSATVAALLFCLAFAVATGGFSASFRASLERWIDAAITPDLLITASGSFTARSQQFDPELGEVLAAVPGVRQVDALRMISLERDERAPLLISIQIDQYLRRSTPLLEEGELAGLGERMRGKNAVVISNNFARLYGVGAGSRIELDSPTGRHSFEVAAVQVDYTSENGSVMLDREVYRRLWRDDRVDVFELMLEPGSDAVAVRDEIQARLSDRGQLFVLTNAEFRQEVNRLAGQFWLLTYGLLLIALVVAALGIVNAMIVSIHERKREIAVLRALGTAGSRIRRSILLEAAVIGAIGLVLGTVVGLTLGRYIVGSAGAAVTGWVFPYRFPLEAVAVIVPITLLACLAAAYLPASRAVRSSISESLAYE